MGQVEVFTPTGVLSGSTEALDLAPDAGAPRPLEVDGARWFPIDGGDPWRVGSTVVPPDDALVVILGEPAFAVHSTWHDVELDVGPYRLAGRLATPPGFDPGRALARPGGPYVTLRDASIRLLGRPSAGVAERPFAHVNRYAVERVASALMLAHFFPGATLESRLGDEPPSDSDRAAHPGPPAGGGVGCEREGDRAVAPEPPREPAPA